MKRPNASWYVSWLHSFLAGLFAGFATNNLFVALAVLFGLMAIVSIIFQHD